MQLSREEFEQTVSETINLLDERFSRHINNVAIFVEDFPNPEQLKKMKLRSKWSLFGLFEGYSQARRLNYGAVLPDRITIFRKPILSSCDDVEGCKNQIRSTLKHEIAHHFGSGEEGAKKAGKRA